MVKEANESNLTGEHVDKNTWRRIQGSMLRLAESGAHPYLLNTSFLAEEVEISEKHYPDQILGAYSESGSLESGRVRTTWFDQSANELLIEAGQESLKGMVEFARQNDDTYFHGTMRMYSYMNDEAEITLDAAGYSATQDPEQGFQFNAFSQRIGLSKLWSQIYENSGSNIVQQFSGRIDTSTTWSVAYALSQEARSNQ